MSGWVNSVISRSVKFIKEDVVTEQNAKYALVAGGTYLGVTYYDTAKEVVVGIKTKAEQYLDSLTEEKEGKAKSKAKSKAKAKAKTEEEEVKPKAKAKPKTKR